MIYNRPVLICDVDGTLMDNTHRSHFLEQKSPDWQSFNDHMDRDVPIMSVVNVVRILALRYYLVICTGRMDNKEEITRHQLQHADIEFKKLMMRKTGDYRSDVIVKLEMLNQLHRLNLIDTDTAIVFDDRTKVVEMWRSQGLRTFQVAQHDF